MTTEDKPAPRPRGRPPTGIKPRLSLRVDPELQAEFKHAAGPAWPKTLKGFLGWYARKSAAAIYAFRAAKDDTTWYGNPELLADGKYETATYDFQPNTPSRFTGHLEVRYGPVPDDVPLSTYTLIPVAGKPMRPTAMVFELLFGAE